MSNTRTTRTARAARRMATVEDLLTKPARKSETAISMPGEDGKDNQLSLALTALGAEAYDALLAEHPPTKEQKVDGNLYNPDTFAPALIAAVVSEPKLTNEQTTEIWTGETWSRGELRDLFMECVNLCNRGLDVPFKLPD